MSIRQQIIIDKKFVADATAAIKSVMGWKFKDELFSGELQTKATLSKADYPLMSYVLNAEPKQWAAIEKALPTAKFIFVDERAKSFDGKGTRIPYRHPASVQAVSKKEAVKFVAKAELIPTVEKILSLVFIVCFTASVYAADYNVSDWGLSPDATDNAEVFNAAIKKLDADKSHTIHVDAMYPTDYPLVFTKNNITLIGNGGFIATAANQNLVDVSRCDNLRITGLTFDGAGLAQRGVFIAHSTKPKIQYCVVKNIGSKEATGNKDAICFRACESPLVAYCTVENIHTASGKGATTGICFTPYNEINTTNGKILHNVIRNITPDTDADGIKFFPLGVDLHCEACDNVIVDCAKRGIKVQGNYVTTRRNLIINAGAAGIDFQGSESTGCQSIDDTVLVTDSSIDPYYGICLSGTNNAIQGARIIQQAKSDNRMMAVFIHATAEEKTVTLNNLYISGCKIPIVVAATGDYLGKGNAQPMKMLSVRNCEILGCGHAYAVQNGFYFSGGGPAWPVIRTLEYRGNTVIPKPGTNYLGPYLNYTTDMFNAEYGKTLTGDDSGVVELLTTQ